jgi:hypothetical protein
MAQNTTEYKKNSSLLTILKADTHGLHKSADKKLVNYDYANVSS